MESVLRQIDHRIAMKKAEMMEKELKKMNTELLLLNIKAKSVNKCYNKILLKDKPVGSGIKLIRYINNECTADNYN